MMHLVVGQGVRLALPGVGLGLVAALAFTHFLSSLLFSMTITNPISFITVVSDPARRGIFGVLRSSQARNARGPDGGTKV